MEAALVEMDKNEKFNRDVAPFIKTAASKTKTTHGNKSTNAKGKKSIKVNNELETVLSSKSNSMKILPASNNISDGDRGENNEHNIHEKLTLHSESLKHDSTLMEKDQEKNTFQMWRLKRMIAPNMYNNMEVKDNDAAGVSIHKQGELTETSIVRLIKGNNKQEQFEIEHVNNDMEDYLELDNYVNIMPSHEKTGDEDNDMEDYLELDNYSNIFPSLGQEHGQLNTVSQNITHSPHISEKLVETEINIDVSICETSNMEVTRSRVKSKHILIGALTCLAVMTAVAGIAFLLYYVTLNGTDNTGGNSTAINDDNMTTGDDYVTTIYSGVTTIDVPVTIDDDSVATIYSGVTSIDVPVTINDAKCFNFRANCNICMEKKITENIIARQIIRAARIGNITQVCGLLKCGASVNSHDRRGVTPLHEAAKYGHVGLTQHLLTYNASVDQAAYNRHTPLYVAARNGHVNVTKLLLTYNASVDKADSKKGLTPLYLSAQNGHVGVVHLLLTYHASVDKAASNGWTPLYAAAWKGHVDVVQLLLTYQASVNKSDKDGWTLLHDMALSGDRNAMFELLCTAGADVNAQTHRIRKYKKKYIFAGSTALHMAVIQRNKIIINTLMFHKAKLLKNKDGVTALDISRQQKSFDITKELRKYAKLSN